MQFGKRRMFFYVNAPFAFVLLIYFSVWSFGSVRTIATISLPLPNTLQITYVAKGITYQAAILRNGVPYYQTTVPLRYLRWWPMQCRQDSFLGLFAEPLGWWGLWLLATAVLLLTPNSVFSKGTRFKLQRRFPWVSMDEFFPAAPKQEYYSGRYKAQPKKEQKKLRNS